MITEKNGRCVFCQRYTSLRINRQNICPACSHEFVNAINETKNLGQKVHNLLEQIREFCEPTGSRFFENFRDDSDWDFYCPDSPEIRQKIKDLGFRRVTDYVDSTITHVYEYVDEQIKIHIQCVDPVYFNVKKALHHNIYFRTLIVLLPKEHHKCLWNLGMSLPSNT